MSNFEAINDLGKIDQYIDNGWVLKYGKDPLQEGHLLINDQGKQVSLLYKGRSYKYIAGLEKEFTMLERVGRAIAGIFATLLTLGIACSFESVRNLFASKKILHIGMDPIEEREVLEKLQGITSVQVHGKCDDETTPGLGCTHKCTIIREGKDPIEKPVTEKELQDLKSWGINVIFSPKIEKTHFKVDSKKNDILSNALEMQDAEIAEEVANEERRVNELEKHVDPIQEISPAIQLFNKGVEFAKINQYEAAIDCYSDAFSHESADSSTKEMSALSLALIFEFWKQPEKAIHFYKEAIKVNKECPQALAALNRMAEEVSRNPFLANLWKGDDEEDFQNLFYPKTNYGAVIEDPNSSKEAKADAHKNLALMLEKNGAPLEQVMDDIIHHYYWAAVYGCTFSEERLFDLYENGNEQAREALKELKIRITQDVSSSDNEKCHAYWSLAIILEEEFGPNEEVISNYFEAAVNGHPLAKGYLMELSENGNENAEEALEELEKDNRNENVLNGRVWLN